MAEALQETMHKLQVLCLKKRSRYIWHNSKTQKRVNLEDLRKLQNNSIALWTYDL